MSIVHLLIACWVGVIIGFALSMILRSAKTTDLELEVESLEMQQEAALRLMRSHEGLIISDDTRLLIEGLQKILDPDSTNG